MYTVKVAMNSWWATRALLRPVPDRCALVKRPRRFHPLNRLLRREPCQPPPSAGLAKRPRRHRPCSTASCGGSLVNHLLRRDPWDTASCGGPVHDLGFHEHSVHVASIALESAPMIRTMTNLRGARRERRPRCRMPITRPRTSLARPARPRPGSPTTLSPQPRCWSLPLPCRSAARRGRASWKLARPLRPRVAAQ